MGSRGAATVGAVADTTPKEGETLQEYLERMGVEVEEGEEEATVAFIGEADDAEPDEPELPAAE